MQTMSDANHRGLVAFVHIPKSGGTTMSALLAHQYPRDKTYLIHQNGSSKQIRRFKAALKQQGSSMRLVQGHFDFSLSRLLPSDTRFFTLLRDPVERAISHYYQYRRAETDPIHPLAMRSTLQQWINTRRLTEMDNGQTRRLAGQTNLPFGEVSSQTLEIAKANLVNRFAVVGLTERFEESQILLHHAFGWPLYRYPASNVGENRLRRTEISQEELAVIENANRFDIELYKFASVLFEQAVSKINVASELALLRVAPEYISRGYRTAKIIRPMTARNRVASRLRSLLSKYSLPILTPFCVDWHITLTSFGAGFPQL